MSDEVLRIGRDQHVWSFDANREPVVTVDPGTLIEIETWDCFTGQVQSESDTLEKLDLLRVNSATGPIAVRGAEPGDSLSVTLIDIRPNEQGAAMCIPGWGQLIDQVHSPTTRIFKVIDGVVTMNERVSFPARPMFGVIGVSPASGDISTFFADRHGGNMDDHVHGIGATLHLPVFQSGGQLAIGDMHASMGDGEISGTGVEIGGTALIKVDLVKGQCGAWPVTETADAFYTHGTSPDSIEDALRFACEEASRLLVDQWGFSPEDAFMFLSVAGDLGIAQYCHPSPGSVIARMRVPKLASNPAPFAK
ncbi:MAG TPA: acetamidase/formamidase family protein [Acidimicrobiales bacterium]|nr:acetamidase/formamidase family protein [Acidimicrobiales bacterium]